jgi:hypothetical protein
MLQAGKKERPGRKINLESQKASHSDTLTRLSVYLFLCSEQLLPGFRGSYHMTLRVISIAGWTEKIITRIETRNRLWKDREGQDDESVAH